MERLQFNLFWVSEGWFMRLSWRESYSEGIRKGQVILFVSMLDVFEKTVGNFKTLRVRINFHWNSSNRILGWIFYVLPTFNGESWSQSAAASEKLSVADSRFAATTTPPFESLMAATDFRVYISCSWTSEGACVCIGCDKSLGELSRLQ